MLASDLSRELTIAAEALAAGDAEHAATHLVRVLPHAPNDPATRRGVADLMKHPAALGLDVELVGGEDEGWLVLRALGLVWHGRGEDGLELLVQVHVQVPQAGYAELIGEATKVRRVVERVDPAKIVGPLIHHVERGIVMHRLIEPLQRLHAAQPTHAGLSYLILRGLRELGRFDDAIAFGLAAREHTTSHMVWLGLAGTYQKMGASAEAKAAFVRVSELEPEDPRVRVDLGDLCLDDGEPAEASRWYREALARDPQNAWAIASEQYTAFVIAKDRAMLADLRALAVAGNERAARLFDRAEAFEVDLFPPKSAAVDGALDAGRRGLTPERIVCVDYEAPSAIQAAREIVGLPADAPLGVTFEHMPVPDPREPEQAVTHTLWTFREPGFFARLRPMLEVGAPALAAPADAVNDVVRSLARTRYSPQGWYRAGQDEGRALGARAVGSLLGAMVRPVPFAKEPFRASESFTWAPHEWRFRLIVAAAFLVAGVDQGWRGSKRREALWSMLHGPVDWTTTASILVLVEIARHEMALHEEIAEVLIQLLPRDGSAIESECVSRPAIFRCASLRG